MPWAVILCSIAAAAGAQEQAPPVVPMVGAPAATSPVELRTMEGLVPNEPMLEVQAPALPVTPASTLPLSNAGETAAGVSASVVYRQALEALQKGLVTPMASDADVDFVRAMLAHHEASAVMAKALLAHGNDPDLRMLAGDILREQALQVEKMRAWLVQHGPRAASIPLNRPRAPAMRSSVPAKPIAQLLEETAVPETSASQASDDVQPQGGL